MDLLNRKYNKGTNLREVFRKNPDLKKALASKLAKNFDINDFLNHFVEYNEQAVKELTELELTQQNFPKEANWKEVLWVLKGQNKLDFREWIDIAVNRHYITGEDIPDKLNDFISSDRDYVMFAKEWKQLLNIRVELLETPNEWFERKGKAKELASLLEKNYDSNYIASRLVASDVLEHPHNPVPSAFREASHEAGLPEKATLNNSRYKITTTLTVPFLDFAHFLTALFNNNKTQVDNLLSLSTKELNEVYLLPHTLTFTGVNVVITDTIAEWEERNSMLSNPERAVSVLAQRIETNFDPIIVGEMLSTREMLEQPQNTCLLKVQEKLEEEQFPKQATAYNVDFDAKADMLLPATTTAEKIIELFNNDYEAINNFVYLPADIFNQFWKFPVFINTLDFFISLKQTAEEWTKENQGEELDEL